MAARQNPVEGVEAAKPGTLAVPSLAAGLNPLTKQFTLNDAKKYRRRQAAVSDITLGEHRSLDIFYGSKTCYILFPVPTRTSKETQKCFSAHKDLT